MPSKTPEQIEKDEQDASRAERERLAAEANKKRNDAMLERRNAIADNSDDIKTREEGLEPLTDEIWAQGDEPAPRRKSREELIEEQDSADDEEAASAAKLLREQESADEEQDVARDAGAEDTRKRNGVVEYRVDEEWLTLAQLRARAGASGARDDLQGDEEGDTTRASRRTSPAERQAAREAEEAVRVAEHTAYRSKLKDLYTRASMGDDEAIDALADIQAGSSRVTPEALHRIVDERVDARVAGRSSFEKAVEWFESEYSDVLGSKTLKAEAARIDTEMARANPEMDARQRLGAVGKQMRQLRAEFGGAAPTRDAPRKETKLDRKRNAPQAISAAAGRPRDDAQEDDRETTQEAIARMANSRGQAHAIKH